VKPKSYQDKVKLTNTISLIVGLVGWVAFALFILFRIFKSGSLTYLEYWIFALIEVGIGFLYWKIPPKGWILRILVVLGALWIPVIIAKNFESLDVISSAGFIFLLAGSLIELLRLAGLGKKHH
jgi:hypothetical protein